MIEKLLPEPQPNSEPMLMGIASAPILQNPLLGVSASSFSSVFHKFQLRMRLIKMEIKVQKLLLETEAINKNCRVAMDFLYHS
jgi:hypothetical protein